MHAWVRKLWYTQRNVCGKRFRSHAEQQLVFKRKTGQGFKWSLHIMMVKLYKSMYVFVRLGFRSPGPQALGYSHEQSHHCFYHLRHSVTQCNFQHQGHMKMTSVSRADSRHRQNRQMFGLELAREQPVLSYIFLPVHVLLKFHRILLALLLPLSAWARFNFAFLRWWNSVLLDSWESLSWLWR